MFSFVSACYVRMYWSDPGLQETKNMRSRISIASVAALLLLFATAAQASNVIVFNALLDAELSGSGSPGTGAATMSYDSGTGIFSWFAAWQDLTAPAEVFYFDGPGPGTVFRFTDPPNPFVGGRNLNSQQIADLFAGLWFIGISTNETTGFEEIRGRVLPVAGVPLPAAVWLLVSALAGLGLVRRRGAI